MIQSLAVVALLTTPSAVQTFVGDPIHGRTRFVELCGAPAARSAFDAAELNAVLDPQLHDQFMAGKCPGQETFDADQVDFLSAWDMVAFVRTRVMPLSQFFPDASRYIHKVYTVDEFGEKRLKASLGRVPQNLTARVYTFFDFEGEKGNLTYVPQDPILLDQLGRDQKVGYLVFVPFSSSGVTGQLAIAMDQDGVVKSLALHRTVEGAEALNERLAQFVGQGSLRNQDKFDPGRNKDLRSLAEALYAPYLFAKEAVTMFVREERDRTWEQ